MNTRNDNQTSTPVRSWAAGRTPDDVRRSIDQLARADDVRRIALMPDLHLGREICVGVAFATETLVYPDAVGGDIGCGMASMAFKGHNKPPSKRRLEEFMTALRRAVPTHRHARGAAPPKSAPDPGDLVVPSLRATAQKLLPTQLGTLGGGNHFLELQRDEEGRFWLTVHSGSRGIGQAVRSEHPARAIKGRSGLLYLDTSTDEGRNYLRDMHWARRFAKASRRAMLKAAAHAARETLGWSWNEETLFDCDHNHIEQEEHAGTTLYIHRKGSMPAHTDVPGIVPGSMAAPTFHVTGRGEPESLCSSAHGAGRAMSRAAAKNRITRERLQHELRDVYVDPRMLKGLRDEAPSAYKDIRAVMREQRDLVKVERMLTPAMTLKGT